MVLGRTCLRFVDVETVGCRDAEEALSERESFICSRWLTNACERAGALPCP